MALLQVKKSDGNVKEYRLRMERVIIGRDTSADIIITDTRVSRRHAMIEQIPDGKWRLRDLGSRNKTLVDAKPINTHELQNGEIFSVGGVRVRFLENRKPVSVPRKSQRSSLSGLSGTHVGKSTIFNASNASNGSQAPQTPKKSTGTKECPQCGASLMPSSILCVNCGLNLVTGKKIKSDAQLPVSPKTAVSRQTTPYLPPSTPSTGLKSTKLTCKCCDKELKPNTKICEHCGIDVATSQAFHANQERSLNDVYMYAESIIRWVSWIVGLGLYPIASNAFGLHKPWVVRGIAIFTTVVSIWYAIAILMDPNSVPLLNLMQWSGNPNLRPAGIPAGVGYHPYQLLSCALLHGGLLHLIGNMLFLMVFGSRINALIGNFLTILIYPLLAMSSGVIQMIASAEEPMQAGLGASGAIMGLAGMYLVLMPRPKVHMAAWWRLGLIGAFHLNIKLFSIRGFWVVLFYIAFDILATSFGWNDGVAHWAHLGGFISGIAVGLILLFTRQINARSGDILSVFMGKKAWALIGNPNRETPELW